LIGGNRIGSSAFSKKKGVFAVPNAAYFRRQADICLRLSVITSDEAVSTRLLAMARDYQATSDALEKQSVASSSVGDRCTEEERIEGGGERSPLPRETPEST
jgi:hypothetical protein